MKIHVFHTGKVCVAPQLPFGGEHCSAIKASGVFGKASDRLWLPVSSYLIESRHGLVLFDCGWHRDMSPAGVYDRRAQIRSLGGYSLYKTNQGVLPAGEAIDEQLGRMGIRPADLDLVLLSHLDCDHANGLKLVEDAKRILVSGSEAAFARKRTLVNRVRYNSAWWAGTGMRTFDWNGTEGPAGRSYDVFGDGSLVMINIPGHSDGLCALRVRNDAGRFVLLASDGGYAERSWKEMITSGIAADKQLQKQSLAWIREQSQDTDCIAVVANHDADVAPHCIEL